LAGSRRATTNKLDGFHHYWLSESSKMQAMVLTTLRAQDTMRPSRDVFNVFVKNLPRWSSEVRGRRRRCWWLFPFHSSRLSIHPPSPFPLLFDIACCIIIMVVEQVRWPPQPLAHPRSLPTLSFVTLLLALVWLRERPFLSHWLFKS
jgi:hypothetical protein